jgi:hypothetical protein
MHEPKSIRIAQSCAREPRAAVEEFHAGVAQPDAGLVLFFCSNEYDRDALAAEMRRHFDGVQVVGCTTAGEVGPAGCSEHSLTGVSFAAGTVAAVSGHLEHLQQFEVGDGQALAQGLLQELHGASSSDERGSFAFLLVDGLSVREELLAHALQVGLGEIPLVGGSAGDGLSFGSTFVYYDGQFHSDSAALVLASTALPFKVFKTQHFAPTEERLVVTEADPSRRVVKEINGLPAAEEYARILGVSVGELDPMHFAASPVVVLIDGANYVRSIQQVNSDGSLTFFCAIEDGLVLRVARGVDLVTNLETMLADVRREIGPPELVLACDCILRRLEVVQNGLEGRVGEVFRRDNAVGFNTYGEQFCGVHVNQTLTGIAIGAPPAEGGDD